jgi:DNA replication protein DnaC
MIQTRTHQPPDTDYRPKWFNSPISEWHSRFEDPTLADAVMDRVVHNAYRLELKGESRRKRQKA